MNINSSFKIIVFLVFIVVSVACKSTEPADPVLTVSASEISFDPEGGTQAITVECNDQWSISSAASWLQLSQTAGNTGNATIELTAALNAVGANRSVVVVVTSSNGQARRVTVSQASLIYPTYNTSTQAPDVTGMSSTAAQLAAKIGLGWNIGNTMESPGGESGWGNPSITEDYVRFVKQQGFNAIRIPCAWDWHHVDDPKTARINADWLNRVKEVIGYCVNNDMYVLLNIHWDGGWLDNNINKVKQDSVNAKQKAYWEQIATAMRDFDEHLLFASANEPPAEDAERMEILSTYHQTFVNAVRSTGGKNSYRVLVVQGPSTDIGKTNDLMNALPSDEVKDRMMVEVHYYTPSQFCLLFDGDASWGKMFYYWGAGHHSIIEPDRNPTWGEEEDVNKYFGLMKAKFIDKGIPVIMGEYGAYRRNNGKYVPKDIETHNDAVDYWITYVTKQAIANGIKPFWWDTGGALDRAKYSVKDQRTIDALNAATKK